MACQAKQNNPLAPLGLLLEHCRRTGQDVTAVRWFIRARQRADRARCRAIVDQRQRGGDRGAA